VLPARHRLTRSTDVSAALRGARGRHGARTGSRLLSLHVLRVDARADQPPRVGFVVSKAVGNAVVRNRTKRVLRALMAARVEQLAPGTTSWCAPTPPAAQATTSDLAGDLDRLLPAAARRLGRRSRGGETSRRPSVVAAGSLISVCG